MKSVFISSLDSGLEEISKSRAVVVVAMLLPGKLLENQGITIVYVSWLFMSIPELIRRGLSGIESGEF
jgi:hypothetical protein